jgi:hypothetical protein
MGSISDSASSDLHAPRRSDRTRWYGHVPDGHSRCSACQLIKLLSEFYVAPNRPRGVSAFCIGCTAQRRAQQYRTRESERDNRKHHALRSTYGITLEEYRAIKSAQGDRCAICQQALESNTQPHLDHDHRTGKVRGILCPRCNTNISILEDDEWREQAEQYLDKHR